MPNLFARDWDRVAPRLQRRKHLGRPISQIEQLEPRVVLTRGAGMSAGIDSEVTALVAIDPASEPAPEATNARSATFDSPAGARKKENVVDIKQWQGTWNVTTDIPFLGGGTMQIRQLSDTKFEVTTTGLQGNQFYAVKTLEGGAQLKFKIKGTDFEGKPRVVGFLVNLDLTTFTSFSGLARVVGGGHDHSISGTLQNGTAPTTAKVEAYFFKAATNAKLKDGVATYKVDVGVINLGLAPIRNEGLKLTVTFSGDFELADLVEAFKFQFNTATPSITAPGQLTVTFTSVALYSRANAGALTIITIKARSNFTITVTASDNNLGEIPSLTEVINPDPVSVTVN